MDFIKLIVNVSNLQWLTYQIEPLSSDFVIMIQQMNSSNSSNNLNLTNEFKRNLTNEFNSTVLSLGIYISNFSITFNFLHVLYPHIETSRTFVNVEFTLLIFGWLQSHFKYYLNCYYQR